MLSVPGEVSCGAGAPGGAAVGAASGAGSGPPAARRGAAYTIDNILGHRAAQGETTQQLKSIEVKKPIYLSYINTVQRKKKI